MIKEERMNRMLEFIDKHQYASVGTLMNVIGTSKSTVRRDLIQLNEEGKICFVRGGAASVNKNMLPESPYLEKEATNIMEKQRIAEAAAGLIRPGETVFIVSGTTARWIFPNIKDVEDLKVITNDIQIANDMALNENVEVFVTGGWLRKGYYTLRGFQAEFCVRNMKIGTAFLSCDAIDTWNGCYIANSDEVGLLHQIIQSSHRVVMMADHSKFYTSAFMQFCDFSKIDILITDSLVSDNVISLLKKHDIKVMVV